ncbi:type II secretion system F family protein [Eubacteriaceae bacterium ES3]|nr:type II secretion system F family protein [Eubacteriaceae bacterium ES3]
MPTFKYTAKTLESKTVRGMMEAADEETVRRLLRQNQTFLLKAREIENVKKPYKLKSMELSDFARQLASMLGSGISVIRAMRILEERDIKPGLKKVYGVILQEIQRGNTLSEAMELSGGSFPELMINIFKAGEASGQLETSARKMADHYEKEHKLREKVRAAMTYPVILFGVTVMVVLLVFTLILPQFFELFDGIELPALTQFMLFLSNSMTTYGLFYLIGLLLIIAVGAFVLSIPKVKLQTDRLKLRVPKIGHLLRIIYTARFARNLSSLYSSGLSMINALNIGGSTVGNTYIRDQFIMVIEAVRNGEALSAAIDKVDGFDAKLVATIYIGEESGRLDEMLENVSDAYDYEAEMATARMVTYIEPIMIIAMAGMVGSIILSVMMPIMTLYQNIG